MNTFEDLMLPHLGSAMSIARRMLRNEDDAQDAVQDSFLRAMRFLNSFDGSNARGWLLAIVRNTCLSLLRRRAETSALAFVDERFYAASWKNAEQQLLQRESISNLHRRIRGLPPAHREILTMRAFQELSYEQIAQAAHIPIGTVMSRLSRGRHQLQEE